MKGIRKKWLAAALAVVLALGSIGAGFAYTSSTDTYEELFNYVYDLYLDDLTNDDVLAIAAALYVVYDHEDELKSALTQADEYGYLEDYGFDNSVYSALFDWLRSNAVEIKGYLDDVVADDTPDAAVYGAVMQEWASEIWRLMPSEFVTRVNLFADKPGERLQLMHLFIQDVVQTSDLGTATGISATDYELDLDSAKMNWTNYRTLISDTTIGISNKINFENATKLAIDAVFTELESEFASYQTIIDVLIKLKLVNVVPYVAPGGGNTGGGTGGGVVAPPPPAPVEQPIPEPEKPLDTTPNPDATYTSLAMRQALQLLNSAVLTQNQVDPVLEDLEKEVLDGDQDIVETLQIVERVTDLIEKLLENDSLTDEGAINYANQLLTQFIAPALAKDAAGGTHHELEALASELVQTVLERIGSIETTDLITDAMVKAAVAEQNNALVLMKEGLSAIFTDAQIAALPQNVSIEIEGTTVKLDPAAVAYMKTNDIGITVMGSDVSMTLPAAMMDSIRAGFTLVVEQEPKPQNGFGNKLASGDQGTVGAVYDLSVYLINTQNEVVDVLTNVHPIVSLPHTHFRTNLHTVGAYYYNETTGVWEYIRSHANGEGVVFRAPHLSIYGVLQRNVVFEDMTTHWAKRVIEELAVKGIVSGRSLTAFEPNGTITRAEFATILVQALQLEGDIKVTFNDVYANDWYYKYVNVAALHGLVSGVGGGKFDPNANITRQDMAIMIMKAYEKMLGKSVKSVPVEIKDLAAVNAYAKDRVLAARFNRLIGGYPDGSFQPLANATRAEAGQMVGNLLSK